LDASNSSAKSFAQQRLQFGAVQATEADAR
jgi:hypothetical protein